MSEIILYICIMYNARLEKMAPYIMCIVLPPIKPSQNTCLITWSTLGTELYCTAQVKYVVKHKSAKLSCCKL